MQPHRRLRESLTPQQLREWYAGWGCRVVALLLLPLLLLLLLVAARCSSRDPPARLSRLSSFVSGIGPAALASGEAAAALGASESPAPGTGAAAALGASESASSGAAHFSTVLPCPAAPSGTLSGLYLPSFSTNLVSGADLQMRGFTSSLLRVAASGQVFAAASSLSLPFLRDQDLPVSPVSRGASGLLLTPPSFPPTEAPLQTLHMDVWGPAPVRGQGHERYFLLVVDDYSRYTTVFPLRSKGAVTEVGDASAFRVWGSRRWQFYHPSSRRVLSSQDVTFDESVPFYRLFPYRTPSLPPPPDFLVDTVEPVEVAAESGPAAGAESRGATPAGAELGGAAAGGAEPGGARPGGAELGGAAAKGAEPGGATSGAAEPGGAEPGGAEPATAGPGGSLVAPSRREPLSPQELREWFARRWRRAAGAGAPSTAEGAGAAGPGAAGPAGPTGAGAAEPGGAESGAAEPGGAESGAAEPGGAESGAAEPGGATSGAAEPGVSPGAAPRREPLSPQELREWFARRWRRTAGAGASSTVEGTGAAGPGGATPAGPTGAGAAEGVGAESAAVCPAGGSAAGAAGGPAAGGVGGAGGAAEGAGAVPAESGAAARPRPYFVPLLQQVLGLSPPVECPQPVQSQSLLEPTSPLPAPSPYTGPTGGLAERREPASRPASPVRAARASGRGSRPRPPPVPGTHRMSLRPSTAPLRALLPSPPESSLPVLTDPESDSLRAASPTVTRLLATVVTDPSFESAAASALVAELVDFAARCRLDYAASLVAESASVCPPSVGGECALGTDVQEDRQEEFQCLAAASPHLASVLLAPEGDPDALDIPTPRSYAETIKGPYSSQWQAAMDAEMASWKSTGTYVDTVPPPGANIVSGMWIFRVKRPPGSPPVFKARYVARGFTAQRDYELHSLDFSTAFLQGSLHEEIWLRRPPGFTGTFPPGTQWSLRRPVYGLRQAPREWHDTLRTTLAALGFAPSTADPSLFVRTDTSLPPFYILVYVDDLVFATADTAGLAYVKSELLKRHTCTDLGELRSYLGLQITRDRARRTITLTQSHMVQQVLQRFGFTYSSPQATLLSTRHSLSALPSDESVESSGPYPELVGCLMYLMTCTRPDLAYPLSILARYVAPGRHRPEHMAAAKRVLRYLCSTSGMGLVLGGRSPVVLTGHVDASWADDQATQRSSQGYTFSLGSGSVSWRATRSSSVLSSSCEAEIYAGAMAAQELRWLTYLLTDLGEPPRSPPVLYVDNKAMLALCREQRLEHRTKHIALRYFLARELQQRGQLRLAYVASEANTADVFTKALAPCDHQRFCTQLGLVPVLPHLLSS
ncbi:unnamed protein product [Closterium sp. NIES-65]|nr:unnamed protein product [Closterium sp. NIES-65]